MKRRVSAQMLVKNMNIPDLKLETRGAWQSCLFQNALQIPPVSVVGKSTVQTIRTNTSSIKPVNGTSMLALSRAKSCWSSPCSTWKEVEMEVREFSWSLTWRNLPDDTERETKSEIEADYRPLVHTLSTPLRPAGTWTENNVSRNRSIRPLFSSRLSESSVKNLH